jgi:hypothetical protein
MVTIQDAGSYLYTSLVHTDSIRLLRLQPNDSSDAPLSGELIEARLNDELELEALSYAWGEDQCQPRTISLDGAQFPVSETLSAALYVFRLPDRPRKIWIDAICINQQDIEERSCQVAQMSAIYKSAAKILIWLGESTDSTEESLQFLRDVAASDHRVDFGHTPDGPGWFEFGSRTLKGSHEDIMKIVEGTAKPRLDDIFGRPWFTRLWIIQEIALAKSATLYCGRHTMEWADFAISLSVLRAAMYTTKIGIAQLSTFQKAWRVIDVKASLQVARHAFFMSPYNELSNFLDKVKNQKCKDDRDRIFGLLGLDLFHMRQSITRGDVISSSITPDYSRSSSEVYTSVAKHYVIQGDLFVLHHAGLWRRLSPQPGCNVQEYQPEISPENSEYLPSWVPEFSNSKSFDAIPWYTDDFNAGLSSSLVKVTVEQDAPFRIRLRGKIDVVSRCIGIPGLASSGNRFDAVCNLVKNCMSAFLEEAAHSSSIIGLFDLALTLVGDGAVPSLKQVSGIKGRVPFLDIVEMWQLFRKHCLQEDGEVRRKVVELGRDRGSVSTSDVLQGMSEEGKKAMAFYESLRDVFEQFQFLITPTGRIGLIPLLAELNDVIFLFPGLKTPYVLRQVKDRGDAVVIGPCYVHGMMDGEVVRSTVLWDSVSLI